MTCNKINRCFIIHAALCLGGTKIQAMVEVFRTNVRDYATAEMLIQQLHDIFVNCKANFDLEDCDKILRVKWINGAIESSVVINLLRKHGFAAEVLPDEIKRLAS